MKVLVIAPQPFFSPRGTPLSVYYRTLIAAEIGVDVDLLTYGQGQDVSIPGVRIIRIPAFEYLGHVKVGPSYLKLWLDVVLFFRMARLMARGRYDVVHAHEEAVFLCLPLRRLLRFKLIYDMHSSLPAQLFNFQFGRWRPVVRLFEWLEDRALRSADVVVTICDDLYEYAIDKIGAGKVYLIENSIYDPVALVANGRSTDISESVPEPERPLVVYTGTLEPYQGIELALRAFARVIEKGSDANLLVAGGDTRQVMQYSALAKSLGIQDRCTFTGSVPKSQARKYLEMASVLISPRISGTNTPLKLYEQLDSGIPLVATRIDAHTQVLTDDVAFLVAPEPESMAQGILRALSNPPEAQRRAENARRLYGIKYSRSTYSEKMNQVIDAVR